jgi:4-amino-4-deoxy-L-arabinose transferase-like glycosyltransferase
VSFPGRQTSVPLLLALPVFVICLGANAIWDANEAFYVETPRQMVLSGDYTTPVFNDAPRLNKPVLSYWIVAGLYHLFGISVTTERVGIALGAFGIIAATFLIGRAMRSTAVGVLAALIMATAPRVVMFARRIFIDVYVSLFMALALACFVLAERHPGRRRWFLGGMYAAIGFGALTKGPVAIVLPAAAIGLWLLVERRLADVRRLMLLPGALIVLAILAPWGLAMQTAHGWAPLVNFIGIENLDRFAESVSGDRPFWFYAPVLLGDLFPWAPLVLVPIVATAWRRRGADEDAASASIRRLLWLWVVVITGAFSLSASKQDLYIFPVMPAVAVLIADALAGPAPARHAWIRPLLGVIGGACLVFGLGAMWLLGRGGFYALSGVTPAGAILVLTGAAAMLFALRARIDRAVLALALGFIAFNYLFVTVILPDVERFKPIPAIADTFRTRAAPGAQLGAFGTMLPSLVYYADQPVRERASLDEAVEFMSGPTEAWLLVEDEEWRELQRRMPNLCVAERRHLFAFNEKLSNIARGIPPPELLLVTRCR